MPPPYHAEYWNAFVNAGYQQQQAVGDPPQQWAQGLQNVPAGLPNMQQTRQQVRQICIDPNSPELIGYIHVMAWGGQGDRFGHKTLAWQNMDQIIPKLQALREGGLNHCQTYNLFAGENKVAGLGPSFFTKLIYFFTPEPQPGQIGFYIMDQWTAKSVDLLTQQWVVRLQRSEKTSPGHNNKCGNYEAFCREVEHIAAALEIGGVHTGDQVEQRLMSEGGHHAQLWRQHVRDNWPLHAPAGRYNRTAIANYTGVQQACL